MKRRLLFFGVFVSVGCAGDYQDDIQNWMDHEVEGMRTAIEPLPEIKTFSPVGYTALGLVDPFQPSRLLPQRQKTSVSGGPPENWIVEPLEAYPLETLTMVGILQQGNVTHALIRAGNALYQVKHGNHMGQNFGVITEIDETGLTLKEVVEDGSGDWVERENSLFLQEQRGR